MENLLIIEDDENLGISLKKFFVGEGYQATLCENLSKAREKIKGNEMELNLNIPVIALLGSNVGIARNINSHWRLIGWGEIVQ